MELIIVILKIIGIYSGVSILIIFTFVISFLAIICLSLDHAVFLVLNFCNKNINHLISKNGGIIMKTKLIFILCLLLLFTFVTMAQENQEKIEKRIVVNVSLKSPFTASVLSVLIPGLGEIYAEDIRGGFADMFATSTFYILSQEKHPLWGVLGVIFHIGSVVGSYNDAKKYNNKILKEFSVKPILNPVNKGMMLSCSLKF